MVLIIDVVVLERGLLVFFFLPRRVCMYFYPLLSHLFHRTGKCRISGVLVDVVAVVETCFVLGRGRLSRTNSIYFLFLYFLFRATYGA